MNCQTPRPTPNLFAGRLRDTAVHFRPAVGIVHEVLDLGELGSVELPARLGDGENVPPSGEVMHGDADVADDLFAFGKNIVEEKHEGMLDLGAGLAQRIADIDLAAAARCHVLDQQHALALPEMTFDLRAAAEPFRLLANIE